MFRSSRLLAIVVACAAVAAVSVALPRLFDAQDASAGVVSPFELYLDCAPGGAIDSNCVLPAGTTSLSIDVVAKNNSGAAVSLAALGFIVVDDNKPNFVPNVAPACTPPGYDCNPDFNQTGVPGGMNCEPLPAPDTSLDGLANTAESRLGCFTGSPAAPFFADGASLVIGTVRYTTVDGVANFSIHDGLLTDDNFMELMSCGPVVAVEGSCFGATVDIGSIGTNTPTNTATNTWTPTAVGTPTPFPLTPSATPTGAVSDVIAMNEGACVAGSALAGLEPIEALIDCDNIDTQSMLQRFLHCLRGFDVDDNGVRECLVPNPYIPPDDPNYPLRSDVILTPVPADFAVADRDADQIQQQMPLDIVAFVDGDYPVLFETDRGEFQNRLTGDFVGSSYLCHSTSEDPDCDAIPTDGFSATANDHAVGARLMLIDDVRGDMHVTVTQNGVSVVKTIHVVGPPETITVEAINGKDTIDSGATAPTEHGDAPLATACDFPGEQQALAGIASPKMTTLLTKALDSDGNEVAGALVDWSPPFEQVAFSNQLALPEGGALFTQVPMLDQGAAGIGYPQVVCGGVEGGDLTMTLAFSGFFGLPDLSYTRTAVVHVTAVPDGVPVVMPAPETGDVIALNANVCASLALRIPLWNSSAPDDCMHLDVQGTHNIYSAPPSLGRLFPCLRAARVHAEECPNELDPALRPDIGDFTAINLDQNQVHAGQRLAIIAFVRGDGLVRFTTDKGALSSQYAPLGTTIECKGADDPDCDGDPATVGDGVVAVYLYPDGDLGAGQVTMTQVDGDVPTPGPTVPDGIRARAIGDTQTGGVDFTIVGPPDTVTTEVVQNKVNLLTSASPYCPLELSSRLLLSEVQGGIDDPYETIAIARAYDVDGNQVIGSFAEQFDMLPESPQFSDWTATIDLGPLGIGAPISLCGRNIPGEFPIHTRLLDLPESDPFANDQAESTFELHVTRDPAGGTTPFLFEIDCNPDTVAVVDTDCTLPPNTKLADVGIVVRNLDSASAFDLGGFTLNADVDGLFTKRSGGENLNANPDLNQDLLSGFWRCPLINPTFICTSDGTGPSIPPGGFVQIARVHYDVDQPANGTATFSITGSIGDNTGTDIAACSTNPSCGTARITVNNAAPTATNTPTATPTRTPTPTPTYTATPVYDTPTALPTGTPPAGAWYMALDCSPDAGVQSTCDYPGGTTSVDVAVVLHVGPLVDPSELVGFAFSVGTWQQETFTPLVPGTCDPAGQDCNPDLDQASLGNGFGCGVPYTPLPDNHPSGEIAVSSLVCVNGSETGPAFVTGADIPLATVHYAATEGSGTFGLASVQVYKVGGVTLLSCNPDSGGFFVPCFGATVTVDEESPTATATPTAVPGDTDGDGIPDAIDNCAGIRNPAQLNSDRNFVELPIVKLFGDTSRAHSDNLGDVCDPDDDNDGLTDDVEGQIGPGHAQHGLCLSASGDTDSLVADSDGDGTIDGAECALDTDPASAASKPVIIEDGDTDSDGLRDAIEVRVGSDPNDVDTDDDGVLDGIEFRGYHTDPLVKDTDGDGCSDGKEIASVDGLLAVNSIDLQQVAQSFSASQFAPNYILDFDVTKNGQINSIDLQFVARQFGPC